MELFLSRKLVIVLFHEERQQSVERPDTSYVECKKLLYVVVGLPIGNNHQNPNFDQDEFKGPLLQGLSVGI